MVIFKIGKLVLRSLFGKPATLMYPVVARQWQERTRGSIAITEGDCILCGICAKKCPTHAITVSKAERLWAIERMKCIQCSNCVEVCPKKCLTMAPEYSAPDTEKKADSYSIPEAAPKPQATVEKPPEAVEV